MRVGGATTGCGQVGAHDRTLLDSKRTLTINSASEVKNLQLSQEKENETEQRRNLSRIFDTGAQTLTSVQFSPSERRGSRWSATHPGKDLIRVLR